ncbi:MAG: HEAT repeat domain-containing protein [Planctomycetaceae bacterium]|nr:HEAT repeat domain-containing protein [Planctomycetaceae bacterium]
MLKISSSLLCGLVLFAATGCQTAHSVKESIASWRPSFSKSPQAEIVEGTLPDEESAEKSLQVEADGSLQIDTASLSKDSGLSPTITQQQPVANESKVPITETQPVLTSFELYKESLKQAELEASQYAEKVIEQAPRQAKMVVKSQTELPQAATQDVDKAFVDTKSLSKEIDTLLSESQPQDSPFEENSETVTEKLPQADPAQQVETIDESFAEWARSHTEEKTTEVKQVALVNKRDAGDIAFDLASFADASLSNPDVLAEVNPSVATKKAEAVSSVSLTEFPWAVIQVKAVIQTEDKLADMPQAEQISVEKELAVNLKDSEEILRNLERALRDKSWRSAAGRASVESFTGDSQPQSEEYMQVAKLINDENPQFRLRGLQLAVEKGNQFPGIVSLASQLLYDEDQVIRSHAASALYHLEQPTEEVLKTLASVLSSDDKNARQFAAMYLGEMISEKEDVVPILETSLLSAKGMSALHVSESLLKIDPSSVDAVSRLAELMRGEDVEVRWLAAHTLGSVQGELQPYAVEALRGGLRDVDSQVRATSALALGGLGNASQVAVAELDFMLKHGDANVKDAASIALDCIRQ